LGLNKFQKPIRSLIVVLLSIGDSWTLYGFDQSWVTM